jgi:small-conductance mechanosensitive channel
MEPWLTIIALSLWMIVVFTVTAVVYSMVFIWKEIRRFGWPLRGIIWFTLAIAGSYVIIALLTGYVQTARSLQQSPTLYRYER